MKQEQRQVRLNTDRERARSRCKNEATEQRQARLESDRERTASDRRNETEERRHFLFLSSSCTIFVDF